MYYICISYINKKPMYHYKEIIMVRPHVAKFIAWYEKQETPTLRLSKYGTLTAFATRLITSADYAFGDEKDLPPQYSAKAEVIIDLPTLIKKRRWYITNKSTMDFDNFCHRLFLRLVSIQIETRDIDATRKAARVAFLHRLAISDDDISEDTVRRMLDHLGKNKREARLSNNSSVNSSFKKIPKSKASRGSDALSVLNLFAE
jgi:hypothetical protein